MTKSLQTIDSRIQNINNKAWDINNKAQDIDDKAWELSETYRTMTVKSWKEHMRELWMKKLQIHIEI